LTIHREGYIFPNQEPCSISDVQGAEQFSDNAAGQKVREIEISANDRVIFIVSQE